MIVVDNRWPGRNGIGRYAAEVIPRIGVPLTPIPPGGSPHSPVDFLVKRISVAGRRPERLYSPGYAGFLRRVPQTLTLLDLIHLEDPGALKYRPYYFGFLRPLVRHNRHVITISETSRRRIIEWVDDPRVDVINAGIGSSPTFTVDGPVASFDRPYVLYVGNMKAHKNVGTVVAATALVPEVDLVIVTSEPEVATELIASKGVTNARVLWGIEDDELASLYRGARAAVVPSVLEGFGLPAQEAALCGTPVIFSEECESVREICAGGGTAIRNATDPAEWADAIRAVEGTRFPSGVVRHEDYSWEAVAATVTATLERFA